MSPKSPEDNAKTVRVGNEQICNSELPRPTSDDKKTMLMTDVQAGSSDNGKTVLVGRDEIKAEPERPEPGKGGKEDRRRAARLSWPARDRVRSPGEPAASSEGEKVAQGVSDDNVEMTRLFKVAARPSTSADGAEPGDALGQSASQTSQTDDISSDPVVGWLVIVEGPGKGHSLEIGAGANAIGRERNQKLRLDFGDHEIHRERHAILVFEPRFRKFFINCGDVRNLTYLNDEVVLGATELTGGETITVGQTRLRFVPFCGPEFGWG